MHLQAFWDVNKETFNLRNSGRDKIRNKKSDLPIRRGEIVEIISEFDPKSPFGKLTETLSGIFRPHEAAASLSAITPACQD